MKIKKILQSSFCKRNPHNSALKSNRKTNCYEWLVISDIHAWRVGVWRDWAKQAKDSHRKGQVKELLAAVE